MILDLGNIAALRKRDGLAHRVGWRILHRLTGLIGEGTDLSSLGLQADEQTIGIGANCP